jgi:hypothetical protein
VVNPTPNPITIAQFNVTVVGQYYGWLENQTAMRVTYPNLSVQPGANVTLASRFPFNPANIRVLFNLTSTKGTHFIVSFTPPVYLEKQGTSSIISVQSVTWYNNVSATVAFKNVGLINGSIRQVNVLDNNTHISYGGYGWDAGIYAGLTCGWDSCWDNGHSVTTKPVDITGCCGGTPNYYIKGHTYRFDILTAASTFMSIWATY